MPSSHAPAGSQFRIHVPADLAHLPGPHLWVVGSVTRWQDRLAYLCESPRDVYVPLAVRTYLEPALGSRYYRGVLDD